ncbi:MAG: ADP-ribosylglycohydrolase family protein [Acidimicrobiia bacterium]|nr:ADP-ribosylglycohydrolase family protein [Acidimicrobiia bacterium]
MRERLRCALIGLAAGDVLGSRYEGAGADPHRFVGGVTPVPGSLYTDDTQQALVLGSHVARHGGVDPGRLAFDFLELAETPERPSVYRGTGSGFRSFLEHLAEGADPAEAAQPSAGNGAAMRVAPIAMRFPDDPTELVSQAMAASLVTHADPRGVAAAAATAAAIVAGARRVTPNELIHRAAEAAEDAEHLLFSEHVGRVAPGDAWHAMSDALRAAEGLLGAPAPEIAAAVGERAAVTSASGRATGTDPYAPASVVTAIVVAAERDLHPVDVVARLVALGGDVDTMAAMGGAIAGARWGLKRWPWKVPNTDVIDAIAASLVDGSPLDPVPDLYAVEASLG